MAGECRVDVRSLSGCYAWRAQGTDTNNVPAAAVGYFYFSGGLVTGQYSGMHNGKPVSRKFESGTATVNADGTGRIVVTDDYRSTETLDFVSAAAGTVLYLVHKREGTSITYEARKV